ncbi:cyclohexanecarboxylate-CoA ligase [Nocardia nova]|uniref:Cyclohexanecarboxylate-CoA ligase n=1 Tax=Nocardia nova TaxID=37330 RepID=A0A2S6AQ78_9NOCA|nr:AMP-binding protein [Nocardia nova]PPJ26595.1 cyclohexanecarboxylate-CoA ligase [Nocardia nova]PPJ37395.1 cyclohexanecarboxylate-CoA ligase [Nocardia nova]
MTDIATYDPEALRAKWYRDGWYSDRTVVDALEEGGEKYADTAVVFAGADALIDSSVGEIHREARRVAAALQGMGVGPGDAVVVQLPNRFECSVAYEAVLLTGATLVPVVHIYGTAELSFILAESGAKVLIMPDRVRSTRYTDRITELSAVATLERIVVVGDGEYAGATSWAGLDRDGVYTEPNVRSDDVCLLVYTSGTTSAPKGVQHSHNSMLAEQRTLPRLQNTTAGAVHLVSFPPGHIAGVGSVLRPILHGTETVYLENWDPRTAVELIGRYGVTSTVGTPFHLTGILDVADRGDKLATLTELMLGAATVPDELGRRAAAAGITTYRCYGSTEHPTITVCSVDDPQDVRIHTDGSPLPGVDVRVLDPAGRDVPAGVDGEIVTRGPDQFVGYRDSVLNRAAFTDDGWMRTGDLGHLDSDGRLSITDRIKDVVIRAGETISSGQIEDVLGTHPAVAEGVVVAAPDERYGEVAAAIVVLAPGAELDLDQIRRHFAASGLAKQKIPEKLVIVDELPRTAVGKIRKADLRKKYFAKVDNT